MSPLNGWLRWPSTPAGRIAVLLFAVGIALRCGLIIAYRPAFLGIPDSGTYIQAAHAGLFSDPVDPAGYPLFLRIVHAFTAHLAAVTVLQHAMGVATAGLLFALGRRIRNTWVGLLPAAVVLLDGLQLWAEHSPLSDPLFTFLCTGALYLTVRARELRLLPLAALGLTLGMATAVRSVGLLLIPLYVVWLLATGPGTARTRLIRAAVPLASAVAIVFGYIELQYHHSGVFGFTESDGRIEYAVAAPFADCSKFTPPAGTRGLCQAIPAAQRGSFNQYLWGFPDHASALPPGGRGAVSPAWRVFGPMPGGNEQLGSFARTAILNQPGAFLGQVLGNFHYYWTKPPGTFVKDASRAQATVVAAADAFYGPGVRTTRAGFGVLDSYARAVEIPGWPLLVLLALSLLAIPAAGAGERSVVLLAAGTGWLLLLGSALVASDPRYALPALGPLGLASAVGLAGLADRIRRRPRSSRRTAARP